MMMGPAQAVAFATFLMLGIAAAAEDFRKHRVGNRLVFAGLCAGFAVYVFLGVNTLLGANQRTLLGLGTYYLPAVYYPKVAAHFGLALAVAVLLWYLRVWPAGDAKLFAALAFLAVLANPNLRGFPDHLFLLMLVNVFVPAGIFVAALAAADAAARLGRLPGWILAVEPKAILVRLAQRLRDEWPRKHRYLLMAWNTFALMVAFQALQKFLHPFFGGFLLHAVVYLGLFLLWPKASALFIRMDVAGISLFLLSAVLVPLGILQGWSLMSEALRGLRMSVGFSAFLMASRSVLQYYAETTRRVTVESGKFHPGMILAAESWAKVQGHSRIGSEILPVRYSDGLSVEEAAMLNERLRETPETATLFVHRPRSFAFWVFLGCLWTILSRKNVVECLSLLW